MIAPFVLSGPINREAFEAYVAKVLVPELRPGDVVVMENLSTTMDRRSARSSIPRARNSSSSRHNSPDFNPIESSFAKLKSLLRKAERTVAGPWHAIGLSVDIFSPRECANYFAAAGYDAD